jgi:hypothetical protein
VLQILRDPRPRFRYPTSANAERFVAHKLADTDGEVVQRLVETWLR